jgi:amidase
MKPEWSRRDFLRLSAAAGAGASLASSPGAASAASNQNDEGRGTFEEATIAQLQTAMANRRTDAVELTNFYLDRIQKIDERGPHLNSVIELNPDALAMAQAADANRRRGRLMGPLHGIPVLLKDNIDSGD